MEKDTLKNNKKICRLYLNQLRAFFPIITRQEKKYLKAYDVYAFSPKDTALTLDDLYTQFGRPEEIFSGYLSS